MSVEAPDSTAVEGGRVRRRWRGDRGDVNVTVLMVPFIIVGMMMAAQFGLAYYAQSVVSGAAQDGAATGARDGGSAGSGQALASSLISQSSSNLFSSFSVGGGASGDTITVTATGQVVKVFPLFPSITVSGTGSASIEEFVPGGTP